jgi:hypothetical protein
MIEKMLLAFVFGILIGFVVQRSKLCMLDGFTELFLLKGFLSLFVITMLGLYLTSSFNLIQLTDLAKPLGVSSFAGGVLFGIGMIFAGGCGIGMLRRVGEGKLKSMIAIMGLFTGIMISAFFYPFLKLVMPIGSALFIPALLGINPWVLVSLILIIGAVYWFKQYLRK